MLPTHQNGRYRDWQLSSGEMRVLITGCSGFIGIHLLKALSNLSHTLMGADVKQPGPDWVRPKHIGEDTQIGSRADLSFRYCDILERSKLREVLLEFAPQAVIHLAARTDLDEIARLHGYAANTVGVENLIHAVSASSSVERCIYTSSQLVCKPGYTPKDDEDYQPHTLYGESKVMGEELVRKLDGGGVTWCIVRPTTVWGPGMNQHYLKFFRMVASGRYFHVGNKPLWKSYGYVGNVVYQYSKLLRAPSKKIYAKTFYLADYEPLSLREWSSMIGEELGAEPIITVPEGIARIAARCGDLINLCGYKDFPFNSFRLDNVLSEYQVDLLETEEICGKLPYTLHQGVKETAMWYRQTILDPSNRKPSELE